ncbi:hypothetical protein M405DRAFT_826813 [Rhizopogon salebrosus TDB-379]|nr:hypothetical protein M405DRAFT_826813 [Rhizopogon salebrosus TDB-379]
MDPVINLSPPISYPIYPTPLSSKDFDLNTDPSLTACETLPYRGNMRLQDAHSEKELPMPPQRVSPFSPVTSVLRYRVHDNYSVGQVLLMLVYTGIIFYVSFYQSDPFTDPGRAGAVITSQVPFVYALATKNNIIGMMVGAGYEKLNFLHRLVGSLMVIGANVHFLGYVYAWSLHDTVYENLADPYVRWGILALVCFDLLGFGSTEFVRSRSYNLFLVTHIVGLIVFLFAACYHDPSCVPYVITAIVVYAIDHIARIVKTHITTARLHPLPELGITRVEVPSLNAGWCAGQHVRIRVLSSSMGWWGWSEVHPFTIANTTHTPEGVVLMCKKTGRWTSNLFNMAQTFSYGKRGKEVGRYVSIVVEGPYGGVGHIMMSSYSGALFVVGGSGISFALSAVQDLVRAGGDSHIRIIDIVWCIQDPASLSPLVTQLASIVEKGTNMRVRVHVFYTRAISATFDGIILPRGITLLPGRPRLDELLDAVVTGTMSAGGTNGVFVGVSGPVTLANTMVRVVNDFDGGLRTAVGGVELHEETFGW